MRIHFVRTGGFAGMRIEGTIDSNALPASEAQELKTELDAARFFELPAKLSGTGGGYDRFQYEITVEDGPSKHTIEAGEAALPEEARPLVQHLERLARTARKP